MVKDLKSWAADYGYKIAYGSADVLDTIRTEINDLKSSGALDSEVWEIHLRGLTYLDDLSLAQPRTVIVVAVQRPTHALTFRLNGMSIQALLPPTYVDEERIRQGVLKDLSRHLYAQKAALEHIRIPAKAVAARLGLIEYGRNNIAYIPGWGSYFQLATFVTDLLPHDIGTSSARGPMMSRDCAHCRACREACPTGAIGDVDFKIDAGRCFVLYNENPGPWPEWLKPRLNMCFVMHSCLLGCLACQVYCPQNAGLFVVEKTGVEFDSRETEWLLGCRAGNTQMLERAVTKKLDSLGLGEYIPVIGRNLSSILECRRWETLEEANRA